MSPSLSYKLSFLICFGFFLNCDYEVSPSDDEVATEEESTEVANTPDLDPKPSENTCQDLSESIAKPYSIKAFTDFIARFEAPVSIPCVVKNLPKDSKVLFTSSTLSVQPAKDEKTPRIFFKLDSLYISISALEAIPNLIELSQELENGYTVKGELALPLTEKVTEASPYTRVLNDAKTGTTCAACHGDESKAAANFPENAYYSVGLRSFDRQVVSARTILAEIQACEDKITFRCKIFNAMSHLDLEVNTFEFPVHFKTMF